MKKKIILAILALMLLITSKSQAEQLGFYIHAKLNSPAAMLGDAIGSWKSTARGDYAYGQARMGSWFKLKNNVIFGVEKRINQYIDFSPRTAEFYGKLENNDISEGVYELDLSVNSNSTEALFIEYDYDLSDRLALNLRAYGLIGNLVQAARLTGVGEVLADGTYNFQTDINYRYGDDRLIDTESPAATGYGHSFDLSLYYRIIDGLTVGLKVQDVFYRLYWSPINQHKGCYANPSSRCDNRFTSQKIYETQAMPVITALTTRYQFQKMALSVEAVDQGRHDELWVRVYVKKADLGFEAINNAFNIGYQSELLKVEWSFDDYRYDRANHWQVSLGTQWAF